jgi:polyisoprenoid-binding protein YceI
MPYSPTLKLEFWRMMMRSRVAVAVLCLSLASLAFAAEDYKIDPVHSSANFSVRHMMVSTVTGRFAGGVSGTIHYDDKDPSKSSVKATIKVASVNTDNENRDKDLRGPNFFDADKYPEITFESQKVEKRGDTYVAIGNFTMKGVTKQIELPFTIGGRINDGKGHGRLGVQSSTTLNRQDYGLSWNRTVEGGGVVVGNEVKIDLNVEGTLVQPSAATPGAGAQ